MLTKDLRQKLLLEAKNLPAILQIGKKGVTNEFLTELDNTLKKKELVKVKFLKSFIDLNKTKDIATEIAQKQGYEVILIVGNTAVFYN